MCVSQRATLGISLPWTLSTGCCESLSENLELSHSARPGNPRDAPVSINPDLAVRLGTENQTESHSKFFTKQSYLLP